MKTIDLNSDVGERPEALADGTEERLIRLITSANIACGVHAGDLRTMESVVGLARTYHVGVGAHPSFPDRANFGRTEMHLPPEQLAQTVFTQVRTLGIICQRLDVPLRHVKPHGALYNMAAHSKDIALAIGRGIERWGREVFLVGLAGSTMLRVWQEQGFKVIAEAFADRRYEPDGSLRSRTFSDALIQDPSEAAQQALNIARDRFVAASDGTKISVDAATICIHSDTPNAIAIAETIRETLKKNGISLKSFSSDGL